MNPLPEALENLIDMFGRLPGIGHRTAYRLVISMLEWPETALQKFGQDIQDLRKKIHPCAQCGNYCEEEYCAICRDPKRQSTSICVVETASQISVIESSGVFRGLYHVLGGKLSPLSGKGPGDLRISELRERLEKGGVEELIIATSPDVEGEATAHFLADEFGMLPILITRIASGIPVGADLNYADAATISMAMGGRRNMKEDPSKKEGFFK
ncbi:MAG: recombination mediator RecR [Lentisphaeria bacterium]